MLWTTINPSAQSREITQEWRGYNHNYRIAEGENYDEQNISSDGYPVLLPRKGREHVLASGSNTMINAITAHGDDLYVVDGYHLYKLNGHSVSEVLELDSALPDSNHVPRQLVKMGAYIVVFPDGMYYNTLDGTDKGSLNASFSAVSGEGQTETHASITYTMCDLDGNAISNVSTTEPQTPNDGTYWLNETASPHELNKYSSVLGGWTAVPTVYIKIAGTGIAAGFSEGDGVTITGIASTTSGAADLNGQTSVIQKAYHDSNTPANDYIIVIGILEPTSSTGEVTVTEESSNFAMSRSIPEMDFVVEADNRLWGCRCGTNNAGNYVNEIYASKLGDFKNWNVFDGLSTDSYMASVGTPGEFTGAINYLGYPLFFKENYIHKVYGDYPANFQINTTTARGVVKGAGRSLAICNERVYYKSRTGVCVYDGSLPTEIASVFGAEHYSAVESAESDFPLVNGAVGGADENKYYLSCKADSGAWNLFVYDTRLGMWHREDGMRSTGFAYFKGELYFVETFTSGNTQTRRLCKYAGTQDVDFAVSNGTRTDTRKNISWSITSGEIGLSLPDKQYIAKVAVKMYLPTGSIALISIQYDGVGSWDHVSTIYGAGINSFTVPILPKRCAYFRIKFDVIGDGRLYSLTKTVEQGSDF